MRTRLLLKSGAIGVIVLFLGTAIMPGFFSANATSVSNQVPITVNAVGSRHTPWTYLLTEQQASELKRRLDEAELALNTVTSWQKARPILQQVITMLVDYGLLTKTRSEEVLGLCNHEWNPSTMKNMLKVRNGLSLPDENAFCFVYGYATRGEPGGDMLNIGPSLLFAQIVRRFGFNNLFDFLILLSIYFPFKLLNMIVFVNYLPDLNTLGLKGYVFFDSDNTIILGYSGLIITLSNRTYFFGRAVSIFVLIIPYLSP